MISRTDKKSPLPSPVPSPAGNPEKPVGSRCDCHSPSWSWKCHTSEILRLQGPPSIVVGRAQVCSPASPPASLGATSHLWIRSCLFPASMLPWGSPHPNPSPTAPLQSSPEAVDSQSLLRIVGKRWGHAAQKTNSAFPTNLQGSWAHCSVCLCVCVCARARA